MFAASDFSASTLAALSLNGQSEGAVKRLRGFRKDRHTVPDAVNSATQAFFAKLCAEELTEEAEEWFQKARSAFGYKRKDISLAIGAGSAVLTARDFTLDLAWALQPGDPSSYTVTRTLQGFRELDTVMSPASDAVFSGTFTRIVFTLARGVDVEAVIDAVEALPGKLDMAVRYPASCTECTVSVPGVTAEVLCTGATLELVFPHAGSPRELIEAFGEVRAAFRFTQDESLALLL